MRHLLILGSGGANMPSASVAIRTPVPHRIQGALRDHAFGTIANPGIMDICGRSGGASVWSDHRPIAVVAAVPQSAPSVIIGPNLRWETAQQMR
jgi:hypothetical protein